MYRNSSLYPHNPSKGVDMRLKVERLFNIQNTIGRIMNMELPAKLSYRFSKIFKKIIFELKVVEEERKKLILKFGAKDDKGNTKVEANNLEAFNQEFAQILSEETDLEIVKIPWELIKGLNITPKELMDLEEIITEPTEEDLK